MKVLAKKTFRRFLIFGISACFMAPLFIGSYKMGLFNVAAIEVSSPKGVNEASFNLIKERVLARLNPHIGEPIWKLGISEITREVKQEKWVKDIRVSRRMLNRFQVVIEPRDVAALIMKKDHVLPVALDGSFLTSLKKKEMPEAPFLSGKKLLNDQALRLRAIEILELLPERGFFSQQSVSEIIYRPQKGFIAVVGGGGFEILLGQKTSSAKIDQVTQVLTYVHAKGVNARVIDARLSKKVLVRPRNGP